MKVIIFNVEHGSCAFVRTQNGHGVMIDCGCSRSFSPVDYVMRYEAPDLLGHNGKSLTKLIISHPHDDHVEDIRNLKENLPPAILQRQKDYNWESLKQSSRTGDCENLKAYATWQTTYNNPSSNPDWGGMNLEVGPCLTIDEARTLCETDYVNNSSIPVFVEYDGQKFVFPGDLMESGLKKLLERQDFRDNLKGTKILVASHHGHTSGFCSDAFAVMGKPDVSVISAHSGDESVDDRYSSRDFITGINFGGETRYRLTTRFDGSIIFLHAGNQSWQVDMVDLEKRMMQNTTRGW